MNETLQQAVAQLIERAVAGIDTATAFLSEQLPDVVYQLLLWYGISSFIAWLISVSIVVLSVVYAVKFFLHKPKRKDGVPSYVVSDAYEESVFNYTSGEVKETSVVLLVISCTAVPFASLVACHNIDWLMILITPKVWLLEYASKLIS